MSTITIELPEQIQENLEAQWQELPRYILEHLAAEGYQRALLTHGQVAEMLGLNYWEAEHFLKAHGPYPNYGLEDLQQDLETLERLRQKQS